MPPERNKEMTVGPLAAVPCPWCGKRNDFRELMEQKVLEQGAWVDCDHCQRKADVVKIDVAPRIILKQRHR